VIRLVRGGGQPITCDVYVVELACSWSWPAGCIGHPNKSAAAIAIDMHVTFAHRTYSTNRRLPNVRKIKRKYICAAIVPTTARQYAGKQRSDRTNQIAATERKACRL